MSLKIDIRHVHRRKCVLKLTCQFIMEGGCRAATDAK